MGQKLCLRHKETQISAASFFPDSANFLLCFGVGVGVDKVVVFHVPTGTWNYSTRQRLESHSCA